MPIVIPITKDSATSLYTMPLKDGAPPLVLFLAGPLVWSPCQPAHDVVSCKANVCSVAASYRPPGCNAEPNPNTSGGGGHCACTAFPGNPVNRQCGTSDLTTVRISANATDGARPLFPVSFSAYGSCAPESLLSSLPSGAAGVAGLSAAPLALPLQVAAKLNVAKQFAVCLPAGGQTGAAIFGGGPFPIHAFPPTDVAGDLRRDALPLVENSKNPGTYYFRVRGLAVELALVPVPAGAFDLDAGRGTGGATLCSVTPYTTLRSDIYRPLRAAFEAATGGVPRAAAPVEPFDLCYRKAGLGTTRLGYAVANIDVMLDNGRNWTLPGGSSLVDVDDHTACFAFLEMESPTESPVAPAVIFGGFQMENNLLLFDLEKGTFGISGLLSGLRTNCGNFDF
ncbi:hypothetical protein ACP4OV_031831 [Aristida adscensionis]